MIQDKLKIAIIQSDLVWEDPEQNRIQFSHKIKSITDSVDIILLPEMFTTGFTMNASEVAENHGWQYCKVDAVYGFQK